MNNISKTVEEVIKHLPAKHNQKAHGKKGANLPQADYRNLKGEESYKFLDEEQVSFF